MTGDDRLRAELEALERSAPTAHITSAPRRGKRPLGRFVLVAATVVVAIAATSLAIDNVVPIESGATTHAASPAIGAVTDEYSNDDFSLTISSPRNRWHEGDSIAIQAVLRYVGSQEAMTVVSSCGPIVFSLDEVGGDGAMHPAVCAACVSHLIRADEPIVRDFSKSGVALGSIARGFMQGSDLRLTAGTWRVTAAFTYGLCGDEPITLVASIDLGVAESDETDRPTAPAPNGRRVEVAGMHVTLPPGWTYHLPTFVSWGPARPVIYFSNQPMHDECIRTGNSETCDRPIDELVPDGVLIDWWSSGEYPYPTVRPLPSGTPYQISGLDAVRIDMRPEDCNLHATEAEHIVFRRSDSALDQLTVCTRDLTEATRTELEELLASVEFTGAVSD